MTKLALVTCLELPEPDPDETLLVDALHHVGIDAELLAWDDPHAKSPSTFDICVLHSCWNYHLDPQAFLAWIDATASSSRLTNPASIVHWNFHKRYLQRLEDAGVPIIPTVWFDQGESVDLIATMQSRSWDDVVIKPAVSASSFRTRRFRQDHLSEGQVFLEALAQDRDLMVQRYMPAVETTGEQSLVWIDGAFTHAVRKNPRFAGGVEQVSGALPVSDRHKAIADRALSCLESEVLYARVDIVNDDDGNPLVSELELIEPSLFLRESPAALERFVKAIQSLPSITYQ